MQNIKNWRFGSGKINALLNLIKKHDVDKYSFIDKIYLYLKVLNEVKYQYLINKQENPGLERYNDSKAFMNIQMIWMIFTKILKNVTHIKNE